MHDDAPYRPHSLTCHDACQHTYSIMFCYISDRFFCLLLSVNMDFSLLQRIFDVYVYGASLTAIRNIRKCIRIMFVHANSARFILSKYLLSFVIDIFDFVCRLQSLTEVCAPLLQMRGNDGCLPYSRCGKNIIKGND